MTVIDPEPKFSDLLEEIPALYDLCLSPCPYAKEDNGHLIITTYRGRQIDVRDIHPDSRKETIGKILKRAVRKEGASIEILHDGTTDTVEVYVEDGVGVGGNEFTALVNGIESYYVGIPRSRR